MDISEIGARVKLERNRLGLSQDELAAKAKIARRALQMLEIGQGNPTLGTMDAIAQAMNINFSELISQRAPAPSLHQIVPGLSEAARILDALAEAPPHRRLAALYLLTKNEAFLDELRALPHGAQFALVLKKAL